MNENETTLTPEQEEILLWEQYLLEEEWHLLCEAN